MEDSIMPISLRTASTFYDTGDEGSTFGGDGSDAGGEESSGMAATTATSGGGNAEGGSDGNGTQLSAFARNAFDVARVDLVAEVLKLRKYVDGRERGLAQVWSI